MINMTVKRRIARQSSTEAKDDNGYPTGVLKRDHPQGEKKNLNVGIAIGLLLFSMIALLTLTDIIPVHRFVVSSEKTTHKVVKEEKVVTEEKQAKPIKTTVERRKKIPKKTETSRANEVEGKKKTKSPVYRPKSYLKLRDDPNAVVEVVLWPGGYNRSEQLHIIEDGIDDSDFLRRSLNTSSFLPANKQSSIETVWLGVAYSGPRKYKSFSDWCDDYEKVVRKAQTECQNQGRSECYWHVHIVDFSSQPSTSICEGIDAAMASTEGGRDKQMMNFVHYSRRSIVKKRKFNEKKQWIQPGTIINKYKSSTPAPKVTFPSVGGFSTTKLYRYRHINYAIRNDIVEGVEKVAKEIYNESISLSDPIESSWERPVDIAHFWEANEKAKCNFRNKVRSVLADYCENNETSLGGDNHYPLYCHNGIAHSTPSEFTATGLKGVDPRYIGKMLQSKIIVVSQGDEFEDHYRLMESLASGAMVMTDTMLTLPYGFQDGISIVEYTSEEDLLNKITFYLKPACQQKRLAIAGKGRNRAMRTNRARDRMEEMIFGEYLRPPSFRRKESS